jgi:carboxypeptidase Taq
MVQSELIDRYGKLMSKYKEYTIFQSVGALIQWDMETKMPPGAFNLRSQQLGLFSEIEHKMATDPEAGTLLEKVEADPDHNSLSELQKRNVYLIRKNYNEQTKLPEKLVSETERQKVIAYNVWKKAKVIKDFGLFKPELTKVFELKKQAAEILMEVKGVKTKYDAMIDYYEPKMTEDVIAATFDELKRGLIPIIEKCVKGRAKPDRSVLKRVVPVAVQQEISKSIANYIGYDIASEKARGRIDETEHPFTNGYYDDVRITTHYFEDDFASSIFSVLHEGGHAMYEQNLNREWMYQPVGAACSYGFHESQSRFVENIVGRSSEFWAYYLPELKRITGAALSDVGLDQLVRAINVVEPSKIRIEADEATYSLHIIIRFELERDLFAGKITVGELPQAWNQKYRDYLGVEIENDSEGVMQDVHWSQGYFGYFPSYALGNIYGGQIANRLNQDMPRWHEAIANGRFQEIREWLTKNVHSYGNMYNPLDLLGRIAEDGINSKYFIEYLDEKYAKAYGY